MKTRSLLACFALLLIGLVLHGTLDASPEKAGPSASPSVVKVGSPAPDFRLKDSFGKEFTLSEFKGKPVVIEWVNQDCPVSRLAHEKGKMQNIYKKFAPKGVIWLGVDSTQGATAERNRVYAATASLAYPILMDADGKVGRTYQAKRTPHLYIVDAAGTLVYDGAIDDQKDKNYVAAALDETLAGRPVSKPKTDPYGCGIKYAPVP